MTNIYCFTYLVESSGKIELDDLVKIDLSKGAHLLMRVWSGLHVTCDLIESCQSSTGLGLIISWGH